MSEAVTLTKADLLADQRARAVAAIEAALRDAQPGYTCFGWKETTVRLSEATVDRPGVMLGFVHERDPAGRDDSLTLKSIFIETKTPERRWFGERYWQRDFEHRFNEPLLLSETCMELLDQLEKQEKDKVAIKKRRADVEALQRLLDALGKLA